MPNTGLTDEYVHRLKREIEGRSDYIAAGKCLDFSEYKKNVGHIQGLQAAEQLLHDTIKMYMSAEDYDESTI
jgi:hypothetical protein